RAEVTQFAFVVLIIQHIRRFQIAMQYGGRPSVEVGTSRGHICQVSQHRHEGERATGGGKGGVESVGEVVEGALHHFEHDARLGRLLERADECEDLWRVECGGQGERLWG
ncbi:MAG: hypothetical protein SGPRY_006334, partial [Prymnesium sp.]